MVVFVSSRHVWQAERGEREREQTMLVKRESEWRSAIRS